MSNLNVIHKPSSDSDIRNTFGHETWIIKYSKLAEFHCLHELLPDAVDYCVMLFEGSKDHGHWVGLFKMTTK